MNYRFNAPRIPPTTPSTKPATNPPPIMMLNTANGKMITSAMAPCPITIMIEAKISVRPMMTPITKPYDCPIAGSQKNIPDQRL